MVATQESQLEELLLALCADDSALPREAILQSGEGMISVHEQDYVVFWIDRINAKSEIGIAEAVSSCSSILTAPQSLHKRACVVFQHGHDFEPKDGRAPLPRTFVLVIECRPRTQLDLCELSQPDQSHKANLQTGVFDIASYNNEARKSPRAVPDVRGALFVLVLMALSILLAIPFVPALMSHGSSAPAVKEWPEDGYIHYPTPKSIGPKRQIQLTYVNAMDWVHSNPHDNGEWRVRMDDQALIPAELWDEDEDYYQTWYYDRYPHLRKIIQQRLFLRPSWLGSIDKVVQWDREFHFNHCLIAFRRYWKAKESGKHVCPRDVDHNHIQHCLNWLDGKAFGPGGLNASMIPPVEDSMIWQTKVCY